jgi:hypothetical protein
MFKEIQFNRERVSASVSISKYFTPDIKMMSTEDFILDELVYKMDAFMYSQTLEEKEISYSFKRPTFLDWLLRRNRVAKFHFKAREVLKNPPMIDNTTIFYNVNPKP